ncbi:uncharacterized protein LOC131693064 isoform X3 [Topomyia yanbarensis]|uniref:uncharacterized protein LOC131693064 isoform X3 n=1 Tax=Topomyia yanbarensis TaxID=2498891 RepID=UPI00273B6595|nr:uncharacterized protein LOC131693064 isoform X3 [Topomyia yanbarensis]
MATTVNNRVESSGGTLGTRKTLIIMVTVVGCIAILWPKVFYPMMTGPGQTKTVIKDHRGPGCCDVVLDQETFANASINVPSQHSLFRKRVIGPVEEHISIRQERPPHLRPETVHPAMRERGRAIPQAGSIHSERPSSQPRIVEGRPGPIPGMRPPMGAGSHQPTKSANSMGFIMPLYTIGIVSFFIYTILKLVFKKTPTAPYPEIKPDPTFRNEVFATEQYIKRPESGNTKLGQPITNAENGVPASAVPVPSSNVSHSVQSEISGDYEQLVSKPERPATTDADVVELEHITLAPKESCNEHVIAKDDFEQPSNDPTTDQVVDGFVVQEVVRNDEEEKSSGIATQVAKPNEQEVDDKIYEAAEAAAVELVEKNIEQAETFIYESKTDSDITPKHTDIVEELATAQYADNKDNSLIAETEIVESPTLESVSELDQVGTDDTAEEDAIRAIAQQTSELSVPLHEEMARETCPTDLESELVATRVEKQSQSDSKIDAASVVPFDKSLDVGTKDGASGDEAIQDLDIESVTESLATQMEELVIQHSEPEDFIAEVLKHTEKLTTDASKVPSELCNELKEISKDAEPEHRSFDDETQLEAIQVQSEKSKCDDTEVLKQAEDLVTEVLVEARGIQMVPLESCAELAEISKAAVEEIDVDEPQELSSDDIADTVSNAESSIKKPAAQVEDTVCKQINTIVTDEVVKQVSVDTVDHVLDEESVIKNLATQLNDIGCKEIDTTAAEPVEQVHDNITEQVIDEEFVVKQLAVQLEDETLCKQIEIGTLADALVGEILEQAEDIANKVETKDSSCDDGTQLEAIEVQQHLEPHVSGKEEAVSIVVVDEISPIEDGILLDATDQPCEMPEIIEHSTESPDLENQTTMAKEANENIQRDVADEKVELVKASASVESQEFEKQVDAESCQEVESVVELPIEKNAEGIASTAANELATNDATKLIICEIELETTPDDEETAIKTIAETIDEAIAQQAEEADEAEIRAIAEELETEETENSETAERLPESNGHVVKTPDSSDSEATEETLKSLPNAAEDALKVEKQYETGAVPKKRETSVDRGTMKVIPMEKKAKYETGRQQSNRPATPVQSVILDASHPEADTADSKCILLDSKSPPASKVVVADSDLSIETLDATHKHCEEAPFDLNLIVVFESVSNLNQGRSLELNVLLGSEPTANVQPSAATRVASPTREVVLSGKMKLSLVKLDDNSKKSNDVVAAEVQDDGAENKKGDSHEWTAPTEE